jgi:MFS family permease
MFSTQIVPFAIGLKIDATSAAGLLTIYLIGTLIGTPLVGWAADKLGGTRMVALSCITLAVWQALLVAHPNFLMIAILAGLAGLQGSAMPPSLGLALSQHFGSSSFAKALGISGLVGLPFAVIGVPLGSWIFVRTGSYDATFIMAAIVLAIGAALTLTMRQSSSPRTATGH